MDTWQVLTLDMDADSRRSVTSYLTARGYGVCAALSLDDLWRRLERRGADVVVVDLRALGTDPLDVLRRLRGRTLAALVVVDCGDDPLDRIVALELGADEVLSLPLLPRELLARIRAFQRRSAAARRFDDVDYLFAGLRFLPAQHRLVAPDCSVQRLTRGECALLHALAATPRRLVSRARLLHAVHADADAEAAAERSIDVVVARLRRKLGEARAVIKVERGVGYRLDCDVAQELGDARGAQLDR